MSTGRVNIVTLSKPKGLPWQFSLRKLLAAFALVSVWCAIASWSLAVAIVLGLLSAYLTIPVLAHRNTPLSIIQWTVALLPLFFLFLTFSSTCTLYTSYLPGTLEVIVKDADTQLPISNASVHMWANTSITVNSSVTGSAKFTAPFHATRHDLGWGRARYDLQLAGTHLFVSAPGYESEFVDWRQYTGQDVWPAEAPPAPPTEIFLKPISMGTISP
jgi:hypothetical protein